MIKRFTLFILMTALLTLALVPAIHADDSVSEPQVTYLIAPAYDTNIRQVYQWTLFTDEVRQITHAENDVLHFGVAYDGLSVAYLSDGQLWLQPIHTEEPETLAEAKTTGTLGDPVYSPDGQSIAYTNDGVWLLDLATRETRQLVANVPLIDGSTNADKFRIYKPQRFLTDTEGDATKLIIDIGVWEWNTVGVYDLATDTLQEFRTDGYNRIHSNLLPLVDGRVLLFGNDGAAGEFALHMAESLDDINTYERVLDFSEITDQTLWAEQAVEVKPGIVRIFGAAINSGAPGYNIFTFDYDVNADAATDVLFFPLDDTASKTIVNGLLSPDGQTASVYFDANYNTYGLIEGNLAVLDLTTGKPVANDFSKAAYGFRWQPQQ